MTYHLGKRELVCHYCDEQRPISQDHVDSDGKACAGTIELLGYGTQRLEEELIQQFPGAYITRIDRDTVSKKGTLEDSLERMKRGDIDILVGTQMLAKGHDFPNVTLVGVVFADMGLKFPDFRASERTFQLVTQVAGRAGRGHHPGKVIVQTYQPDHPAIQYAAKQDYLGFAEGELRFRKESGYPPYVHLSLIQIDGEKESQVQSAADKLARVIARQNSSLDTVLGPVAAPLQKLRGRIRHQIIIKSKNRQLQHSILEQIQAARLQPTYFPGVRIHIDRDPYHLL